MGGRVAREYWFDHERLAAYQESIAFVAWSTELLERVQRAGEVKEQLDRASTSVPLNIAEGNAKFSKKDRCRFFDIAYGSALESAAALDVLVARRKATELEVRAGKESLQKTVRLLLGLIKRDSDREYGGERAIDPSAEA